MNSHAVDLEFRADKFYGGDICSETQLSIHFDFSVSCLSEAAPLMKRILFEADSHRIALFHRQKYQSHTTEKIITSAGSLL